MVWLQVLAFALGVLASVVAWLIVWRLLSPKVEFSPDISRRWADDEETELQYGGKYRLRAKVRNARRGRPAMELEFSASLRFKSRTSPGSNGAVELSVNPKSQPFMSKNILLIVAQDPDMARSDQIYLERQGVKSGRIDEVLSQLKGGSIRLYCIATDSYSGSRRAFIRDYGPSNIKDGPFVLRNPHGRLGTLLWRWKHHTHPILEIRPTAVSVERGNMEEGEAEGGNIKQVVKGGGQLIGRAALGASEAAAPEPGSQPDRG